MLDAKVNTKASSAEGLAARARDAGTAATQAAATAAQTAAAAAQTAAQSAAQSAAAAAQTAAQIAAAEVGKGVRQRVRSARGWAAPRLEDAADYTTSTVAPKVSSALRATAEQVRPEDMRRKKAPSAFIWSILGAAVLAAMGAAGALVWQRYRAAMAADTEEEAAGPTPAGPADTASSTPASSTDSAATSAETGVNGQVSTPKR